MFTLRPNITFKKFDSSSKQVKYLAILEDEDKYYEISEMIYNICSVFKEFDNLNSIREYIDSNYNISLSDKEIEEKIIKTLFEKNFLDNNHEVISQQESKKIIGTKRDSTGRKLRKSKLLLFDLTIINADISYKIAQRLSFLFKKYYLALNLFLIIISHIIFYLFLKNDIISIYNSITISKLGFIGLLYSMSVFIHEFGHISACKFYGAKPRSIGLGIYLNYFVLYSDITDSWSLSRKNRAIIDIAGIYFQQLFATIFIVVYVFSSFFDWIPALIILIDMYTIMSFQPFLKFDGYWLVSDLLGIANLHKKVFEFCKFIFKKFVMGIKIKYPDFFRNLTLSYKLFFVIYLISSISFFTFIGYQIVIVTISMISTYYIKLYNIMSMFNNSYLQRDLLLYLHSIYKLFFLHLPFFFWIYIIEKIYRYFSAKN